MKTLIVIPAYNEELTIESVVVLATDDDPGALVDRWLKCGE